MKGDIRISAIVAAAENAAIGYKGDLPWKLPNDLKFYKYTTWGLPVIMGRHSFESIGSKRLPGRFNIVLSGQKELAVKHKGEPVSVVKSDQDDPDQPVWLVSTPDKALDLAATMDCKEVFIIGGAQIYKLFMDITDRIFLTRVHASPPNADTFFPEPDWAQWNLTQSRDFGADERHAYAYTFETWERKNVR
jgi:dihydrofolate reductase